MTVAMKGVPNCTDTDEVSIALRYLNKLLNGGCFTENNGNSAGCSIDGNLSVTIGRCQRIQADYVFEFLGFVFGLGVIALGWVLHRRGGTRASYV
jgi:hypothetical protein